VLHASVTEARLEKMGRVSTNNLVDPMINQGASNPPHFFVAKLVKKVLKITAIDG
jgi:hypothetical protein